MGSHGSTTTSIICDHVTMKMEETVTFLGVCGEWGAAPPAGCGFAKIGTGSSTIALRWPELGLAVDAELPATTPVALHTRFAEGSLSYRSYTEFSFGYGIRVGEVPLA